MQRSLVLLLLFVLLAPWAQAQDITTSLTLYYKFDDASGAPQDSSGNARHGTLSGTATRLSGGSCKLDGCFGFSAANSTLVTQAADAITTLMTTTNGTFAAWVNPHGTSADRPNAWTLPAVFHDSGGAVGISRGTVSGANDSFWAWNWGSAFHVTGTSYTLNQWVHLVWVHSASTTLTLYKNGVSAATVATAATGSSGTTLIGQGYAALGFLDADLDELRFYNRALTAGDVQALFTFGQATLGNRWRMMQRTKMRETIAAWLWPGGRRVAHTSR
jgi:Concanavalin A-like lectin/glucanases superfamily